MSFDLSGKRGSPFYANSIVKNNIFTNGFYVIEFTTNITINSSLIYYIETFFLSQPYVLAIDPIDPIIDNITIVISKDLDKEKLFNTLKVYLINKINITIDINVISSSFYKYFFYCSYLTKENLVATKIIINKVHDTTSLNMIQKESIYNAFMYRYINYNNAFFKNINTSNMPQFKSKNKNTDKIISYYLSLN